MDILRLLYVYIKVARLDRPECYIGIPLQQLNPTYAKYLGQHLGNNR